MFNVGEYPVEWQLGRFVYVSLRFFVWLLLAGFFPTGRYRLRVLDDSVRTSRNGMGSGPDKQ